jgi:hypothetical protein
MVYVIETVTIAAITIVITIVAGLLAGAAELSFLQ